MTIPDVIFDEFKGKLETYIRDFANWNRKDVIAQYKIKVGIAIDKFESCDIPTIEKLRKELGL